MILDVIFCALWCVGILALVWGLAGWLLLPLSGRQSTVLFPDGKEGALERQLRTNAWLRAAGLERGMVYVVYDGLSSQARQEAGAFCAGQRLSLRSDARAALRNFEDGERT